MFLTASSVLMTLVAVNAVVNVVAHTLMLGIGLALAVAIGTSKYGVVGRVGMASGAHAIRVAVVSGEPGVIEGRSLPRSGGVTGLAGRGESRRCVVRIGRGLIVSLVTGVAICRNRGVVVVHVTVGASHGGVRTRERKGSVVVIER